MFNTPPLNSKEFGESWKFPKYPDIWGILQIPRHLGNRYPGIWEISQKPRQ